MKEKADVPWSPADGGHVEPVPTLKELEDRVVQNQLSHVVAVKPGFVRSFILKRVLSAIDALARYYFVHGRLGTIGSIHFARWVFIDDGKRFLFFSNYDGSWESYLGDFIDLAAIGLTGVWSNTVGFPAHPPPGGRKARRTKSASRGGPARTKSRRRSGTAPTHALRQEHARERAHRRGLVSPPFGSDAMPKNGSSCSELGRSMTLEVEDTQGIMFSAYPDMDYATFLVLSSMSRRGACLGVRARHASDPRRGTSA